MTVQAKNNEGKELVASVTSANAFDKGLFTVGVKDSIIHCTHYLSGLIG